MQHLQIRTGLIGCGNIGQELAIFLLKSSTFKICTVTDADVQKAKALQKLFSTSVPSIVSIADAILRNEFVIEAASPAAVSEILECLSLNGKKIKFLCMSTGGLYKNYNLIKDLKEIELLIPSGAIAGLDAIKAVAGEIEKLELKTTKPAASLAGATFVRKHKLQLLKLKKPKLIFEGRIKKAIEGFPENINVAATLFLASRFRNLKIKIIADPSAKYNSHEIICSGDFGVIQTKTINVPSNNPKTSYLAIASAKSVLRNLLNNLHADC